MRIDRKPASFAALCRRLEQLDAEVGLQQTRARQALAALKARTQGSAGWLIPTAGALTGLALAHRRARGVFASGVVLWRLLAGPVTAALAWLGPLVAAQADAQATAAKRSVNADAGADPATAAADPAATPAAAARPH